MLLHIVPTFHPSLSACLYKPLQCNHRICPRWLLKPGAKLKLGFLGRLTQNQIFWWSFGEGPGQYKKVATYITQFYRPYCYMLLGYSIRFLVYWYWSPSQFWLLVNFFMPNFPFSSLACCETPTMANSKAEMRNNFILILRLARIEWWMLWVQRLLYQFDIHFYVIFMIYRCFILIFYCIFIYYSSR